MVTIRQLSRDKGQKAGPQIMPSEILIFAAETIFWISGPNKIWEIYQVSFGETGPLKILPKSFSDDQVTNFISF